MNKIKKKKSIILICAILLLIVKILITQYFPVKISKNLELNTGAELIPLNYDMKQIYVRNDEDYGWVMRGYDGYYFNNSDKLKIKLKGNFPNTIQNHIHAMFILNGYYEGVNNVFYVESYDLLKDLYREKSKDSFLDNKSEKYLSPSDLGCGIFDFKIKVIGDENSQY